MRFSLRSLLIGITLVAVALGSWLYYRQATFCEIRWLSPGSAAAKSISPTSTIQPLADGRFGFTYNVRNRDVQMLSSFQLPAGDVNVQIERESVTLSSPDLTSLQSSLQSLESADQRKPGTFVIRGRVVDHRGKPVARATIDLMGSFVFINHFETRDDGTFAMPLYDAGGLTAPAGSGYYLCVRPAGESGKKPSFWNTPSFSLSPNAPELDVEIVMPRGFR